MKNWYIVQTFSGFENKVAETLKETIKKKELSEKIEEEKMFNPFKFVQGVKLEVYKVTWPTKKEVLLGSFMVFVLATIAAIFFLLLDQIYKFLLDIILTINI